MKGHLETWVEMDLVDGTQHTQSGIAGSRVWFANLRSRRHMM